MNAHKWYGRLRALGNGGRGGRRRPWVQGRPPSKIAKCGTHRPVHLWPMAREPWLLRAGSRKPIQQQVFHEKSSIGVRPQISKNEIGEIKFRKSPIQLFERFPKPHFGNMCKHFPHQTYHTFDRQPTHVRRVTL